MTNSSRTVYLGNWVNKDVENTTKPLRLFIRTEVDTETKNTQEQSKKKFRTKDQRIRQNR